MLRGIRRQQGGPASKAAGTRLEIVSIVSAIEGRLLNSSRLSRLRVRLAEVLPPEGDGAIDSWRLVPRKFRAATAALPSPWEEIFGPLREGTVDSLVVVGQIGQSLDGRTATVSGHSHNINGPAGLAHLHRLRSLVDVVVIGVGTALADDPQLTVRCATGPNPARRPRSPRENCAKCSRASQRQHPSPCRHRRWHALRATRCRDTFSAGRGRTYGASGNSGCPRQGRIPSYTYRGRRHNDIAFPRGRLSRSHSRHRRPDHSGRGPAKFSFRPG
jgi:hypothetical protein